MVKNNPQEEIRRAVRIGVKLEPCAYQRQAITIYPGNVKEKYLECSINEDEKKLLDKYLKMTTDYSIVSGEDTLYLNRKLSDSKAKE